mmetsp:Transcript_4064/g.7106  ORF Transcript_4064/g.7106 Transcript_4064/m.7106 type:complete len:94 (-) Transcript_4064:2236-2517(-)
MALLHSWDNGLKITSSRSKPAASQQQTRNKLYSLFTSIHKKQRSLKASQQNLNHPKPQDFCIEQQEYTFLTLNHHDCSTCCCICRPHLEPWPA